VPGIITRSMCGSCWESENEGEELQLTNASHEVRNSFLETYHLVVQWLKDPQVSAKYFWSLDTKARQSFLRRLIASGLERDVPFDWYTLEPQHADLFDLCDLRLFSLGQNCLLKLL